jgi:hypothetical protein
LIHASLDDFSHVENDFASDLPAAHFEDVNEAHRYFAPGGKMPVAVFHHFECNHRIVHHTILGESRYEPRFYVHEFNLQEVLQISA